MPRDKVRIDKRDKAMYKRYIQLYDVKRKRHDDVIKQLEDEFFINPETISRVIRRMSRSGK